MRKPLLNLINSTIIFEYNLPNLSKGIDKTIYSIDDDNCFSCRDINSFIEIIYNSIIEYSFNEFDLNNNDFENLLTIALKTKIKYNEKLKTSHKIKYGFLGEVVLYSLLNVIFKSKPLIARGYFYNPLESSETKGYDSYHLIEGITQPELWFGEVKFHTNYKKGINSVFENINKALSDNYLEQNVYAINNHLNNLNIKNTKIEQVLNDWNSNPNLKIIDEIKQHNMKLVYPIMILYEENKLGYDESIKIIPEYVKEKFENLIESFDLSIDYSIFFILMPLKNVKHIKETVIEWIDSKKPLLS